MSTLYYLILCLAVAGCRPGIPERELRADSNTLSRDRQGLLKEAGQPFSGYLLSYYGDSTLKSRAAYAAGLLESVSEGYYPTGELMYSRFYVKGEKHGAHRGYFPDGSLRFLYYFEHGKSVGNHQEWYAGGQLAKELNYVDGQPFGSQKMWRPDGKIRSNYVIREDGRRYGLVGLKRCKNIDTELEQITRLSSDVYDQ